MTEKEKAIAYDEVIQKLRGMMPNWERLSYNGKTFLQDLIYIFPELAESEDEKIREDIISLVNEFWERIGSINPEYSSRSRMIAWLEKQGTSYTKRDVDDAYVEGMTFAKNELEKQGKQILANSEKTCKDEKKHALDIEIPFGAKDSELQEATYLIPEGFHAEIEGNEVLIKKGKQNPAWSEEDMSKVQRICKYLNEAKKYYADITEVRECMDWLKSIENRMKGE